ncbi:MAG: hypothetical protein ACKVPJ_00815 [Chitinophagales bacterium]
MQQFFLRIFFLATFYLCFPLLHAQVNSPYSRIGLGNIFPTTFTGSNGMAGLSVAQFGEGLLYNNIQFNNPATYSYLSKTVFDVGLYANFLTLQTSTEQFTSGDANLSYFALGFSPNNKKTRHDVGFSTGLIPFSGFQYNIEQDSSDLIDTLIGLQTTNYRGTGQLNQFYIGGAYNYKFGKDTLRQGNFHNSIGAGINIGYLFGSLENITVASFPETSNSYSTKYVRDTEIGGGLFSAGITYQTTFGKYDLGTKDEKKSDTLYTLNFGASFSPQLAVNGTQSVSWFTILKLGDVESITDTLLIENDTSATILIPSQFNLGLSFNNYKTLDDKRTKFSVGAEFTTALWSNFEGFQYSDSLQNSYRVKLGTEIIPPRNKKDKRLITYRFGAYAGKSQLVINNTQLSDFGITAGTGLPVGISRLNLSANLGFRGYNADLNETYVNFGLGFNLNDLQWFQKRQQN